MNKNKKPTVEQTASLLTRGAVLPERENTSPAPVNTPGHTRNISVTIDDIGFYEFNPRTIDNPAYEDLKASIEAIGLQSKLTITKRPGDPFYTLCNGGNTRLKALKQLYKETKDDKFYYLDCFLQTFTSDSEMVINHMVENETRGDMALIDKAVACARIKKLYESETGKTLSIRKLSDVLAEKGWRVSFALVGVFIFTDGYLVEHIPLALRGGMGKSKVIKIRKTYKALETYLKEKLPDLDSDAILDLYLKNLNKYDIEQGYDESYALTDTCRNIGEQINVDAPRVQLEINTIIDTGEVYREKPLNDDWNDLGQRVIQPDTETVEKQENETGAGENKPQSNNDSEQSLSEHNKKLAPGADESIIKISPLDELRQVARNKVKMITIKYPLLAHLIIPNESFPYFSMTNEHAENLKVMVIGESKDWDNETCAAICEAFHLMKAYYITVSENSASKSKEHNEAENSLSLCKEVEDIVYDAESHLYTLSYCLATNSDSNKEAVYEPREQFSELSSLLRKIRKKENEASHE